MTPVLSAQRQRDILERLDREGWVSVTELCEQHQASASTVRRDLAVLADLGLVERVRGGATRTPLLRT